MKLKRYQADDGSIVTESLTSDGYFVERNDGGEITQGSGATLADAYHALEDYRGRDDDDE